jgi:ribosome-binding factor A
MDPRRAERLSEALREELAELIEYELKDPRLAGVTVTEALLGPDGRHVQVAVAVRGDEAARRKAFEALEHAANYLRLAVATRLRLFRPPEIHFMEVDQAGGDRVGQLLERIRKNREKTEKKQANEP